ncbi:probable low affinity copper uptake protein 2 [Sceloporus undulatus]|uniref:probable low affinity copper uptake protein 2 n=1 Tax=Sceloporus undulatus TaxID=8520 RepID=UPI001C4D8BDC|nr:probable low affinity copper uptake protein 2 [Sceloporus undulatus]
MMPMHFYFSDKVVLLFDFWNVHSPAGMVLSVVVIMLLAVLYEAIKVGKVKLIQRTMPIIPPSISQETLGEPERGSINMGTTHLTSIPKIQLPWHVAQTFIHVVQVVLGYLVMLAVMSYNSWIFLGVIVGSAVGYYVAYPLLRVR